MILEAVQTPPSLGRMGLRQREAWLQDQEPCWSLNSQLPSGLEPSGPKKTFLRFLLVILAPGSAPGAKSKASPTGPPSAGTGQMGLPLELRWRLAGFSVGSPLSFVCHYPWGNGGGDVLCVTEAPVTGACRLSNHVSYLLPVCRGLALHCSSSMCPPLLLG